MSKTEIGVFVVAAAIALAGPAGAKGPKPKAAAETPTYKIAPS
jgi:hypothetical protein